MAKDLVCGKEVDEKTAKFKKWYTGKTYYFCTLECQKKFEQDPKKYIAKEGEGK